jgi:hypothetical protein
VETFHAHLGRTGPATAELALGPRDRARLSLDEQLGHLIRGQPRAVGSHDLHDLGGLPFDGPLARLTERRTAGFARLPEGTAILIHFSLGQLAHDPLREQPFDELILLEDHPFALG